MNTYQVSYRYAPEHTSSLVSEPAPTPPKGIKILAAWAYVGERAGFFIVEANTHQEIAEFTKGFRDRLDITVRPIYPLKK